MVNVEPILTPLVTERGFALRNLVRVVRERIVNSSAMNIKIFAKML
jgi:hypothetical protein